LSARSGLEDTAYHPLLSRELHVSRTYEAIAIKMPLKKHKEYSAEQQYRQAQNISIPGPHIESEVIETRVGSNDVLTGRGAPQTDHGGNVRLRQLVMEFQPEYATARRQQEKHSIAIRILDEIESRGGRFLRRVSAKMNEPERRQAAVKDGKSSDHAPQSSSVLDGWVVVNDRKQILEKVKQLFRDMGPESQKRRHIRRLYRYRKLGVKPGESGDAGQQPHRANVLAAGSEATVTLDSVTAKRSDQNSIVAPQGEHDYTQTLQSFMPPITDTTCSYSNDRNMTQAHVWYPSFCQLPLLSQTLLPTSYFQSDISNSLTLMPLMHGVHRHMRLSRPHPSKIETSFGTALAISVDDDDDALQKGLVPTFGSAVVGRPQPDTFAVAPFLYPERNVMTSTGSRASEIFQTGYGCTDVSCAGTNGTIGQPPHGGSVASNRKRRQPKSPISSSSNH